MKIVKENISFERDINPKNSLNLGTRALIEKWILNFRNSLSDFAIAELGECIINKDLSITVFGKVDLRGNHNGNLPPYIRFKDVLKPKVEYNKSRSCFISVVNTGVTSLEGYPELVEGDVSLSMNKLGDLINCPKIIRGDLYLKNCELYSLEGAPDIVGRDIYISGNPVNFTEADVRKAIPNIGGKIYTRAK